MEKEVVNAEIDILKELGVEFKTGVEVGKDVSLNELKKSRIMKHSILQLVLKQVESLGIEGEDAEGVITGVDFLRKVNLGEDLKIEGKAIVIGGGNVAIDVARTATRIGASKVDMYLS